MTEEVKRRAKEETSKRMEKEKNRRCKGKYEKDIW